LDGLVSVFELGIAIDPFIQVVSVCAVILDDVEHDLKLAENEHLVIFGIELLQQLVEDLKRII
jgi:hypothetical protein